MGAMSNSLMEVSEHGRATALFVGIKVAALCTGACHRGTRGKSGNSMILLWLIEYYSGSQQGIANFQLLFSFCLLALVGWCRFDAYPSI